jgi:hypothetical protein
LLRRRPKLTIIGEAVARLSPELTARHNAVPWPDIVGLRNILVHEYFGMAKKQPPFKTEAQEAEWGEKSGAYREPL